MESFIKVLAEVWRVSGVMESRGEDVRRLLKLYAKGDLILCFGVNGQGEPKTVVFLIGPSEASRPSLQKRRRFWNALGKILGQGSEADYIVCLDSVAVYQNVVPYSKQDRV